MKREYFIKQVDASMEEIIGAVGHAMLVAMDGSDQSDYWRRYRIEQIASEIRNVGATINQNLDTVDEEELGILSDRFHSVLAEDLQFASVPLEDGGESE